MRQLLIGSAVSTILTGGVLAFAFAPAASALTCAESGETPGTIESVLEGTHPRSGRWDVIAAGSITNVEPHNGDYATWGATVTVDIRYWLRGHGGSTFEFYDPPAGSAGIGFEFGSDYLVLAYENDAEGRLETGLCDLTYKLADYERVEQLVARFGASSPDTASLAESDPRPLAGALLLILALLTMLALRSRTDGG
jgi:hypothetical protein